MLGCRSVRPRSVRASTTLAEAAVERLDRAAPRVVVFYKRVLGRGSLADGRGSSWCPSTCASANCTFPASWGRVGGDARVGGETRVDVATRNSVHPGRCAV